MEGWFRFKGRDSRSYGILIASPPQRVRPQRRVEEITVPGRNGVLTQDEKTYDAYTISMECGTRGSDYLDEIIAWLDGAGELTLSMEPDKVYRASIYNKISIADQIYLYNSFLLQFKLQPFKYSVNPLDEFVELTAPSKVLNHGTVYAEPIITVFGSGDITLTINGTDFPLYGVEDSITIDSERMEVYKGTANQNSRFGGADFPRLEVGENDIGWTGNVVRVEIEPQFRWL